MPDKDGYPTPEERDYLAHCGDKKLKVVVPFLRTIWWGPEFGVRETQRRLYLSTAGWSGNEELIEVLEGTMFWMLCWESSRRGGHYVFNLSRVREVTND